METKTLVSALIGALVGCGAFLLLDGLGRGEEPAANHLSAGAFEAPAEGAAALLREVRGLRADLANRPAGAEKPIETRPFRGSAVETRALLERIVALLEAGAGRSREGGAAPRGLASEAQAALRNPALQPPPEAVQEAAKKAVTTPEEEFQKRHLFLTGAELIKRYGTPSQLHASRSGLTWVYEIGDDGFSFVLYEGLVINAYN